ncbi:MAG: hypothetical protein F4Y00_10780 [Bacteroidetes bacterium SB0662_bin_6]|nr:hypothetical protein [Bacteroidetes bacterium SB0668_bin_1]MYE05440.1 hypothetical protein [Bacteroidetes bacterium SB0662_bin_6]
MNSRFIAVRLKALFLLVPMLVVGFTPIAPAWSQNDLVPTDPNVLNQLVSRQIIASLQSSHAQVRSQTLKNVIVYATLDFDQVDLAGMTAALAEVAEEDELKSNRRLAVAALRSIDSWRAKRYLSHLDGMGDTEYRSLVASVLSEYHTTQTSGSL